MPRGRMIRFFAFAAMAVALTVLAAPSRFEAAVTSAREVSVLVMPFEVNAGADLQYLRQGLQEMLSDRLRDVGFSVVSRADVDKALAAKGLKPNDPRAAKEVALLTGATYVV